MRGEGSKVVCAGDEGKVRGRDGFGSGRGGRGEGRGGRDDGRGGRGGRGEWIPNQNYSWKWMAEWQQKEIVDEMQGEDQQKHDGGKQMARGSSSSAQSGGDAKWEEIAKKNQQEASVDVPKPVPDAHTESGEKTLDPPRVQQDPPRVLENRNGWICEKCGKTSHDRFVCNKKKLSEYIAPLCATQSEG